MQKWFDRILWKFSTCPYCGSLFRDPHFLFCTSCFQSLWLRRNPAQGLLLPSEVGVPPFPIRSLFLWQQDKDVPLSLLLKMMKGGDHPECARVLMSAMSSELLNDPLRSQGCILIPAPAKTYQKQDHAWVLAKQLEQLVPGSQVHTDFLERKVPEEGPSDQKKKSRHLREKLDLQLTPQGRLFRKKHPQVPIYFVDDILTTGSTAKAAWKVLGKPSYFQVLVLAYRKQPSLFDILRS